MKETSFRVSLNSATGDPPETGTTGYVRLFQSNLRTSWRGKGSFFTLIAAGLMTISESSDATGAKSLCTSSLVIMLRMEIREDNVLLDRNYHDPLVCRRYGKDSSHVTRDNSCSVLKKEKMSLTL